MSYSRGFDPCRSRSEDIKPIMAILVIYAGMYKKYHPSATFYGGFNAGRPARCAGGAAGATAPRQLESRLTLPPERCTVRTTQVPKGLIGKPVEYRRAPRHCNEARYREPLRRREGPGFRSDADPSADDLEPRSQETCRVPGTWSRDLEVRWVTDDAENRLPSTLDMHEYRPLPARALTGTGRTREDG